MLMFVLAAAAAQAAVPSPPPPPAAEPPIAIAAKAFSGCIRGKFATASTTLSPEAAADDLIAQCATEKAGLDAAFAAILAKVPEAEKAAAQKEYDEGMAEGRRGVIDAVTSRRSAGVEAKPGQPVGR